MKLPIEWIKEYVPIEASPEELAHRLTMAGLEVEETAESSVGPVLDIKVTPNRGDCLSVMGVARELAAAYKVDLRAVPHNPSRNEGETAPITAVAIEAPELCPRYAARIIRSVKSIESPAWMQARLIAAGMRPVSGIVDVTNYVMLETGQPHHAFDYDTLAERRIVVRRARPGEQIVTLDGQERVLNPEMLVICDAEKPVAVAGVMGGGETEMGPRTRTVLLESAHFNSLSVRRTSRTLNLRTEASYRFERVVDPAGVAAAADRACALIAELGMGEVVSGIVDCTPIPIPSRTLNLRPKRVTLLLGFEVSAEAAADSLTRLGFGVTPSGESLNVTVPTWRPDVVREEDMAEEVGRVLGYENIPERLPHGSSTQGGDSADGRFNSRIREVLAAAGLQEVATHTLLAPGPFEDSRTESSRIAIRSALSAELSGLRRSLLPGLLEALDRNARRGQSPLAMFEVGHIFHATDSRWSERTSVGGVLCGSLQPAGWRHDSKPADFHAAHGIVERLSDSLHLPDTDLVRSKDPRLHPGRSADVLLNGATIGWVGELHPRLSAEIHVRERIVAFELDASALQEAARQVRGYEPLSPFPSVVRDLAPRVPVELECAAVKTVVESVDTPLLEGFELTDVYIGNPLPEGTKSLTLSFTFRAQDRTLTEEEVTGALSQIRHALETRCGATFPA